MRKAIVVGLALLLAHPAVAALSDAERHRLAAFVSYVVTTAPSEGGSSDTVKVGDWCPDCTPGGKPLYPSKPGMVGDGSVFEKCGRCGGTQKVQPNDPDLGDMESFGCEICEAFDTDICDCDCGCKGKCGGTCGCDNCNCGTPERDELFDNLDNPPAKFNESYVRDLEYDLQKALEEVQSLKADQTCQQDAEDQPEEIPEETPEQEESSSKTVTLYRMKGSRWNWSGRSNPATSFMRQHLMDEHGIDASLMNREQMQILHDNAHNYGDDKAFGFPTEYNSSMTSCPDGQCPLPGSSGSGSCPTCPGGSSSRSRGLFGRWR